MLRTYGGRALLFPVVAVALALRVGSWVPLLLAPAMASALVACGAAAGVARHATAPLQDHPVGDKLALVVTALAYVAGAVVGIGVWVGLMVYLRPVA